MALPIYETPEALTPAEIAAILAANPVSALPRSTVQTPHGPDTRAHYRSSRSETIRQPAAILERLRARMADLCGLPVSHIEPAQLVCYDKGGHYGIHNDNPQNAEGIAQQSAHGGLRVQTAVVALSEGHRGGGVFFPERGWPVVHPKLGYFTRWRNIGRQARHEALEVESGQRIVLVLFARERPYVE